jgi:hypothetical protein
MSRLPLLKTGAILQYPAERHVRYRTDVLEFVDGTAQAYRDYPGPLRRWVIQLNLLDPAEIRSLEEFFHETQGSFGTFSFVDPGEQVEYENCSFESSTLQFEMTDETRGRGVLVVRQNRA